MTLELTSQRADAMARQLADATGEDIATAVERAREERLARITNLRSSTEGAPLEDIFDRLARMAIIDPRAPEEIMGFDETGLPH